MGGEGSHIPTNCNKIKQFILKEFFFEGWESNQRMWEVFRTLLYNVCSFYTSKEHKFMSNPKCFDVQIISPEETNIQLSFCQTLCCYKWIAKRMPQSVNFSFKTIHIVKQC